MATNAGGLCCVKYGVTRDSLLALEVVLADGRAVRLGRRTLKGVAGYDLVGLMCGSEGTLGIVTEATVRLCPPPRGGGTLAASFPALRGAGEAIARIAREQRPSLLELMDGQTIRAVEAFQPQELDPDAAALVFARSDDGRAESLAEVAAMERICEEAGADLVVTTDEEAEGRMLMAARRLAFTALEHRGATLLDDVGVPLGAIPALLDGVDADRRRVRRPDRHVRSRRRRQHAPHRRLRRAATRARSSAPARAFEAILALALTLGGTITGEHGVGLLKRAVPGGRAGRRARPAPRDQGRAGPPGRLQPRQGRVARQLRHVREDRVPRQRAWGAAGSLYDLEAPHVLPRHARD